MISKQFCLNPFKATKPERNMDIIKKISMNFL